MALGIVFSCGHLMGDRGVLLRMKLGARGDNILLVVVL